MTPEMPIIWIISGPIQVGKTHFCNSFIKEAQAQGFTLAGVVCPPVFEEQNKTAINIEDLKTHKTRILATKRTTASEGLLTDHWAFNEEVLRWGNLVLAETEDCDILLIDELGPLEFNRGQGWQNGLLAIDKGKYRIALVVIRPALVETAINRWPNARLLELSDRLEPEEIKRLVDQLLSSL